MKLTAVFVKDEELGGYSAYIAEIPGANTQGETLEEARHNLQEATSMILELNRESSEDFLVKEGAGAEVIREEFDLLPQHAVLDAA